MWTAKWVHGANAGKHRGKLTYLNDGQKLVEVILKRKLQV